jgi:hypothetical protein
MPTEPGLLIKKYEEIILLWVSKKDICGPNQHHFSPLAGGISLFS